MYIINVFKSSEWDMWFGADGYNSLPKQAYPLKNWAERENADMVFNLTYFNMSGEKKWYNIQYLRKHSIGDCGYSGTPERLILPNGDIVAGYKEPSQSFKGVRNNAIYGTNAVYRRSRNMLGLLDDGCVISVQTTYGYTEYDVCKYVVDYFKKQRKTVKLLLVMDAGGSTGCYSARAKNLFAPEKEGTDGRWIPSVFCVKRKLTAPRISRTLWQGMRGDDVAILQSVIGSVEVDGIFGKGTRAQVVTVQRRLGLVPDGVAGPLTLGALGLKV